MDTKRGESTSKLKPKDKVTRHKIEKSKDDCGSPTRRYSKTQYFRKERHGNIERIPRDKYYNISESISGSSDTFHCIHGPEGKKYTKEGLLKRFFRKELDPKPTDPKWTDACVPAYGWEMASTLQFILSDTIGSQQMDRIEAHLRDFAKIASSGYRIDVLDSLCAIMNHLVENLAKNFNLKEGLINLLQNMNKPILLRAASDITSQFQALQNYIGYLGFLLMRIEDDDLFNLVSEAIIWHLSAPDSVRGHNAAQLRHTLTAAAPVLSHIAVKMLAMASRRRFPTYLQICLLLACDNDDNCVEMTKYNIIENIFYRFNPYFPERELPEYDINPADPQDVNVKLGDSSLNIDTTLSLLLILLNATKKFVDENPQNRLLLPSPDFYSQRCFIWAYRFECRAREHRHERIALTVIVTTLLHCFRDRLTAFASHLMPDLMTLSVLTEVSPRQNWTRTVEFNTSQQDVYFKKCLIYLSVDLLKVFSYNHFMIESQHWLLGLMYLIDPGLCQLRARWSSALFAELRKATLQALVCTIPLMTSGAVQQYGLVRRIMWYVEWYSESPYELPVLYWCIRVLQVAVTHRSDAERSKTLQDLFDTHGIIILMHLCYTLLDQKQPPVEKSQVIIGLCLRLLTNAIEVNTRLSCCVYPQIRWPSSINFFARKMLNMILYSLDKGLIVSDRWTVSLLNFIWDAIIWKKEHRKIFISDNGVYKLLDLITMTRPPVQCIALGVVCDVARAGDAVGQLVTWRAPPGASNAYPSLVKRGSTIASLLAAVFRDECRINGISLDDNGIIRNLTNPLESTKSKRIEVETEKYQWAAVCYAAADAAGSRMSKAYAILQMLSHDLDAKVSVADETYNLYKNISLSPEDETILVLCSHYLTLKLNETWREIRAQFTNLLSRDEEVLQEFLHVGRGWSKHIKQEQEDVIEKHKKKDLGRERSLYEFLGRVRLNIALDALREVRCMARSACVTRLSHAIIQDAVLAYHRRSVASTVCGPVLTTYRPPLDEQNVTGQNIKICSISPKKDAKSVNVDKPVS